MTHLSVHRCRFVHYTASTIVALAWTPSNCPKKIGYLAVARANGNIELWNPRGHWFLEKIIPGHPEEPVEALCWVYHPEEKKLRLFAAGLVGTVIEYDWVSCLPIRSIDSMGGAIWSMKPSPDQTSLAIGCEDGQARLFSIEPNGLVFVSSLEKQKDRVMSLDWHPNGSMIALGSVHGVIRLVDVETKRTVHRMTLESARGEGTIIWDLQVLVDGTLVAADSLGHVTFWDSTLGTLKKLVKAHQADALCLATSADGKRVYSSGVDRRVVEIKFVSLKDTQPTWVLSSFKRYHTHDVRALLYLEEKPFDCLISGGVDTSLIFSGPVDAFKFMKQQRMPTYPHRSPISLAEKQRLMACHFDDHIKVWSLGQVVDGHDQVQDKQRLNHQKQRHLLTLYFKGDTNIVSIAISSDGQWIAASNGQELRVYRLTFDDFQTPTVTRVRGDLPSGLQLKFTPDASRLIVGGTDAILYVLNLGEQVEIIATFDFHQKGTKSKRNKATILSLAVSNDNQWLVSGDHLNRLAVFSLDTLQVVNLI